MQNEIRQEKIKSDFIFNIIYQVVTLLTPLILTPKLARIFQPDYLGLRTYTFSIASYFAMIGVFGFNILGQQRIAFVKDDEDQRSKIFWSIFLLRGICVFLCLCLYIGYIFIFSKNEFEKGIYLCWILYIIREMITPVWFFQGLGKYKFISILNIISQILYVAFSFIFITDKSQLPLYIIFYTAIPLAISLIYFPFVFKYTKIVRICINEIYLLLKDSIMFFIPAIVVDLYSLIDKTMLGLFDQTKVSTGLYESSEKLVKIALALLTASYTIIRTRMSYFHSQKKENEYKIYSTKFMSFSMLLCWPIAFGIIGISKDFVPLFFGNDFSEVINLSYVFSLIIPCIATSGLIQAIFIFPFGLEKKINLYHIIVIIANIVMNLFFIYSIGVLGAVLASVLSEFLFAIILIIKAKKQIEIKYLFKCSIKYIISSFIMLFIIFIESKYLMINLIIKVIIEFTSGIFIYVTMCLILQDEFVLNNIKIIFNFWGKRKKQKKF